MATTLHIENTVHDFAEWKDVFDKFERYRADNGVRSYRMYRRVDEPNRVAVDLMFDAVDEAVAFRGFLEQVWQTPQSKEQLVDHASATLFEVVVDRDLSAAAASAS